MGEPIFLARIVGAREMSHNAQQREVLELKIQKKNATKLRVEKLTMQLLQKCKSWGGPFIDGEALVHALNREANEVTRKSMVRIEVQYFKRLTSHLLALEPDLFKINNIEYELQLANLIRIIDGGCDTDTGELVNLPTAVDVLNPFQHRHYFFEQIVRVFLI